MLQEVQKVKMTFVVLSYLSSYVISTYFRMNLNLHSYVTMQHVCQLKLVK